MNMNSAENEAPKEAETAEATGCSSMDEPGEEGAAETAAGP